MTSIELLESTGGGSSYVVRLSPDNIQTLEINKESTVMPFSLPLVDETVYNDSDIGEKIDLVAISGIGATLNISFWIKLSDISTLLSMVTNRASVTHQIKINEWDGIVMTSGKNSGSNMNYKFYGRIGNVKISITGGTPNRLQASVSFYVGSIVDFGDGI